MKAKLIAGFIGFVIGAYSLLLFQSISGFTYYDGKIDALREMKQEIHKLVTNPDSTKTWKEIKK